MYTGRLCRRHASTQRTISAGVSSALLPPEAPAEALLGPTAPAATEESGALSEEEASDLFFSVSEEEGWADQEQPDWHNPSLKRAWTKLADQVHALSEV